MECLFNLSHEIIPACVLCYFSVKSGGMIL